MIHEDMTVAAIDKEGAAEFSNIRRCFHPTGRLRIEISKSLQFSILFFCQKLDAHDGCHINGVASWIHTFLLPRLLPITVITYASAAVWTFR